MNHKLVQDNDDYDSLGLEPIELALREQLGETAAASDLGAVPATIERLINAREEYRPRFRPLRDKYVYDFGNSSRTGAAHIMMSAEDAQDKPIGDAGV